LPRFVDLPSVGIDVSDFSIKFIELVRTRHGIRIGRFGERKLPEGVVVSGAITKRDELVEILKGLKHDEGLHFVRASLPEEEGFFFESSVPRGIRTSEARSVLELRLQANVPLSPADAVFAMALDGKFDAVVAMYHDQGMIPVKLLAFETAVNVTLGLPMIRTSVDHGTAYDIAGRNTAGIGSLKKAVRLAIKMESAAGRLSS